MNIRYSFLASFFLAAQAFAAPQLTIVDDTVSEEVLVTQLKGRIDVESSVTGCWYPGYAATDSKDLRTVCGTERNKTPHAIEMLNTLKTNSVALCGICDNAGMFPALSCALGSGAKVVSISQSGRFGSVYARERMVSMLQKMPLVVFAVPNYGRPMHIAGFVTEAQSMDNVVFAVSVDKKGKFENWVDSNAIPKQAVVFATDGTAPDGSTGNSLATPRIAERLSEMALQYPEMSGPGLVEMLKKQSRRMKGHDNIYILASTK